MIYEKQWKNACLFILQASMVIINTVLFAAIWYVYYKGKMWGEPFFKIGDYVLFFFYLCLLGAMSKLYGGMALTTSRISELIYSQVVAIFITNALIYMVILLLTRHPKSILPLLLITVIQDGASVIWAYVAHHIANHMFTASKVLLVYDNVAAYKNGRIIIQKQPFRFQLVGEIEVFENDSVNSLIDKMSEVGAESLMLCGLSSSQRNDIIKYCVEHDIRAFVRPNIGDFLVSDAKVIQMANLPVMICERATLGITYVVVKRLMDIVISLLGLIITSPILLITSIAIKAYDHGPILYKQTRLTRNGKRFEILKFRSMKIDAEKDGMARLSSENDDRITPVGKVIRAIRIDELPQLINILRGELSVVGPRPERPEIAEQYVEYMPEFSLRLQVKAGLTGYAQVYGKYNTEPYDKLQMDLMYINQMGIVSDMKIILATIKILFMSESTEGISEGQTTAISSDGCENSRG